MYRIFGQELRLTNWLSKFVHDEKEQDEASQVNLVNLKKKCFQYIENWAKIVYLASKKQRKNVRNLLWTLWLIMILWHLSGLHLFQQTSVDCWIMWFIYSWEGHNYCQSWANSQNDIYFHSKRHPRTILSENRFHFVDLLSLVNNHLQDWKVNIFLSFSGER